MRGGKPGTELLDFAAELILFRGVRGGNLDQPELLDGVEILIQRAGEEPGSIELARLLERGVQPNEIRMQVNRSGGSNAAFVLSWRTSSSGAIERNGYGEPWRAALSEDPNAANSDAEIA